MRREPLLQSFRIMIWRRRKGELAITILLPIDAADTNRRPAADSWAALPPAEQLLLWSMRHMLLC